MESLSNSQKKIPKSIGSLSLVLQVQDHQTRKRRRRKINTDSEEKSSTIPKRLCILLGSKKKAVTWEDIMESTESMINIMVVLKESITRSRFTGKENLHSKSLTSTRLSMVEVQDAIEDTQDRAAVIPAVKSTRKVVKKVRDIVDQEATPTIVTSMAFTPKVALECNTMLLTTPWLLVWAVEPP